MKKETRSTLPVLELVIAAALWGGMWPAGRLSVRSVPPVIVPALRFGIASAVFLSAGAVRREPLSLWKLRAALAPGISGILLYNLVLYYALHWAPAADGAMIIPTLNPIFTLWASVLVFKEQVTRGRVLGLALALGGQALVFYGALTSVSTGSERLLGDAFFVLGALLWSIFTVTGKKALERLSALELTAYSCYVGTPLLIILALPALPDVPPASLTTGFWVAVFYMSLAATVIGNLLWHRGLHELGAARASLCFYLIPVFGLIFSAAILGEKPTAVQLAGVAIVLAGVALSDRSRPLDALQT
ncbi:MAG: DMT family transporter [Armatimonadetes bacterium]|nr:DMT family transporter [Armatimonadota bacterium]